MADIPDRRRIDRFGEGDPAGGGRCEEDERNFAFHDVDLVGLVWFWDFLVEVWNALSLRGHSPDAELAQFGLVSRLENRILEGTARGKCKFLNFF